MSMYTLQYSLELEQLGISRNEFLSLYPNFPEDIQGLLSQLHAGLRDCFRVLNSRIPPRGNGHYKADDSRKLLKIIDIIFDLRGAMRNDASRAFELDAYYKKLIDSCRDFLQESNGSGIPVNLNPIELYLSKPIFISLKSTTIEIDRAPVKLSLIDEGSYAKVFSFEYPSISKKFALKRAKKDELDDKEKERFKREFATMKALKSPYILEIYSFDEVRLEYIMEHADQTLYDYIQKNNQKISLRERKSLVLQVLKSFEYIHSKKILHRDISPKNILIKKYDDAIIIKISDFGLVKIPESMMTSITTEFKGYYNDPELIELGFKNYEMKHELYALSTLICFIMLGKENIEAMKNCPNWGVFLKKGHAYVASARYQSMIELKDAFYTTYQKVK